MSELFRWSCWRTIVPPATLCVIGGALWWQFGYTPLDRLELPLAILINGLTGRSEAFDWLVIFFNRLPGEAVCVVIILTAFVAVAAWAMPKPVDWRRVAMFAGYVFVVWFVVDIIGGDIIENTMPRDSPSHFIGDEFVDLKERYNTRVKTSSNTSFPSNHGGVFFTVFFMMLMRFGRKAWVLLPLCIVLSSPRAFTGAHWMSDTLIGSVLVAWTIAALAVRTPVFRIHMRLEDAVCNWWDRKLFAR